MASRVTGIRGDGRSVWPGRRVLASLIGFAVTVAGGVAAAAELAPIDRWADIQRVAPARLPTFGAGVLSDYRGQVDERLGVPTFLWAGGDAARAPATRGSAEHLARGYLARVAAAYRADAADVEGLVLQNVSALKNGSQIVQFRNEIEGIEVFRERLSVLVKPNGALVSISGVFGPSQEVAARVRDGAGRAATFNLSQSDALAVALADFGFDASAAAAASVSAAEGGYSNLSVPANLADGRMNEPARVRSVWFRDGSSLVPAYYIEVMAALEGDTEVGGYAYVVDARQGKTLFRHNLVADATYRVYGETSGTFLPYAGPEGHANAPHATGQPDGVQPPFVASQLLTLDSGPIADPQHVWLAPGATETTGNNVDAIADLVTPDGFNAGDLRGAASSANTFDYVYDTAQNVGVNATQRQAGIVNLFYMNNWLHDWYYDAGFDEASGNAQTVNYSGQGVAGDSIRAEAQDYSGTNNANMSTPSDGGRPRMQMFTWSGSTPRRVDYVAGAVLPSETSTVGVLFTPTPPSDIADVTNDVVIVDDGSVSGTNGTTGDGCQTPFANAAAVSGKIALVDRVASTRGCSIGTTLANVQANGAIAVLFVNSTSPTGGVSITGSLPTFLIPYFSVSNTAGNAIKTAISLPSTVTLRLRREPPAVSREGGIDNAVIAHEWGHYISNRLVQNSAGLTNTTGRGMGEGWADFHSLLMQVKEGDDLKPSNPNFNGTYSVASYSQSGPSTSYFSNVGPYFGIRRYPYSSDFNKNPLTYGHTVTGAVIPPSVPRGPNGAADNAAVHNQGEVWASMLWDCYAGLLRDKQRLSFAEAQDRMKRYVIAGYKLTPAAPTMVEARDAILSAMYAEDEQDFLICGAAFARRGAGAGAIAADRFSTTNAGLVQSFAFGRAADVISATIDESAAHCDADGIFDNGEDAVLRVTFRNSGFLSLTNSSVTVSSPDGEVSFPSGATHSAPQTNPLSSASVDIPVRLDGFSGLGEIAIDVEFNDSQLGSAGPAVGQFQYRVNGDILLNASTSDDAESPVSAWTTQLDVASDASLKWGFLEYGPSDHTLFGPNLGLQYATWLISPTLNVSANDPLVISFVGRHQFEAPNYDGGVIEYSTDGGMTWADITTILGTVLNPAYSGNLDGLNQLGARAAYRGSSASLPAFIPFTVTVPGASTVAGQSIKVRLGVGTDPAVGAYGWEIDDVSVTGITNTPFSQIVAQPEACVVADVLFGDGFEGSE